MSNFTMWWVFPDHVTFMFQRKEKKKKDMIRMTLGFVNIRLMTDFHFG